MRGKRAEAGGREARLAAYLQCLSGAAGHADRVAPMASYTKGLLLPIERKSVEPMAACLAPGRVRQMHQSLHHVVAEAAWNDEALLGQVRDQVLPLMTRRQPLAAWIVDDTGFPKKGKHSVGVARQYCGQLGKQDNCQVAVTVSGATVEASLPLAHQLYLPEAWAQDVARRKKAGVPAEAVFQTKAAIALGQLRHLTEAGVPRAPVLADAGYGNDGGFREGLDALGLSYAVGVQSFTSVWPPGPPLARPQRSHPPRAVAYPACPPASAPEALPARTERHNPHSLATLKRQLASRPRPAPLPLLFTRLLITQ